jgi:hypothetical protein
MPLNINHFIEVITMKHSINMKKLIANTALAGAFSMTLLASQAWASFIDYDHSAESVQHSSAPVDTGTPMKSGGFIDYDHSAESVSTGDMRPNTAQEAPGMCGFLDCDHSPHGIKS